MDKRVIAGVVGALLIGVILFIALGGDYSPKPIKGNSACEEEPPATHNRPNKPDVPKPEVKVGPDPVIETKPVEEFQPPKDTYRIICKGIVVSEDSGPVKNAHVSFSGTGGYRDLQGSALTDDFGQYTLLAWQRYPRSTMKGGSVRIVATTSDGVNGISNSVEPGENKMLDFEEIMLATERVLEGRVSDAQGNVMANVTVRLQGTDMIEVVNVDLRKPSVQRTRTQRFAVTDQGGMFQIYGLPASRYKVTVLGTFAGDFKTGSTVDLCETQSHWLDISLSKFKGVRGIVRDSAGNSLPGVIANLIRPDSGLLGNGFRDAIKDNPDGPRSLKAAAKPRMTTDESGRYFFGGLSNCKYKVEFVSGSEKTVLSDLEVSPNTPIVNRDATLDASGRFTARVVDAETNQPIETFHARMLSTRREITFGISPFQRANPRNKFGYHAGGNFALSNPHPDNSAVQVTSRGYAVMMAKAESGSTIKLVPLCTLDIDLTTGDKKKLALEPLLLIFDNHVVLQATSDEFGRVRIPDVVPGKYAIRVYLADNKELRGELEVPVAKSATLTLTVEE
ncbi:MAG: carboxypeptidase-like regulatory domain-containing protein [Planctomycetota bacterium]